MNDYFALLGLFVNFIGTICLVYPRFRSRTQILAQAGTYYEGNPHLKETLARDSAYASTGFVLMAVGFLLQILSRLL